MPVVTFRFSPRQHVIVSFLGLNYRGRINRCIQDGGPNLYQVDYAVDGEIQSREFYEDELEEAKGERR